MKNPFIHSTNGIEYVAENCSLNNVVLKRLPVYGIEDSIQGKTATEIFSTKRIISDVKQNADRLNIDLSVTEDRQIPQVFFNLLEDETVEKSIRNTAENLVKTFGYRLGAILAVLKTGYSENKLARQEWSEECWQYWANVKNIIMVGGLTHGEFGKKIIFYALQLFKKAGIEPYNILIFENATHVGVMGSANLIKEKNGINIVMDFGQTNLKRSVVKRVNGEITDVGTLSSLPSKYMESKITDMEEGILKAKQLHQYLIKVIADTYITVAKRHTVGNEIVISIGNYVKNGELNSRRGGYAKLSMLYSNYAECLSEELSGVLRKNIKVTLVHDGTAVALYFKESSNSVCITMGTGLGVGFPEIKQ